MSRFTSWHVVHVYMINELKKTTAKEAIILKELEQ